MGLISQTFICVCFCDLVKALLMIINYYESYFRPITKLQCFAHCWDSLKTDSIKIIGYIVLVMFSC